MMKEEDEWLEQLKTMLPSCRFKLQKTGGGEGGSVGVEAEGGGEGVVVEGGDVGGRVGGSR